MSRCVSLTDLSTYSNGYLKWGTRPVIEWSLLSLPKELTVVTRKQHGIKTRQMDNIAKKTLLLVYNGVLIVVAGRAMFPLSKNCLTLELISVSSMDAVTRRPSKPQLHREKLILWSGCWIMGLSSTRNHLCLTVLLGISLFASRRGSCYGPTAIEVLM